MGAKDEPGDAGTRGLADVELVLDEQRHQREEDAEQPETGVGDMGLL